MRKVGSENARDNNRVQREIVSNVNDCISPWIAPSAMCMLSKLEVKTTSLRNLHVHEIHESGIWFGKNKQSIAKTSVRY